MENLIKISVVMVVVSALWLSGCRAEEPPPAPLASAPAVAPSTPTPPASSLPGSLPAVPAEARPDPTPRQREHTFMQLERTAQLVQRRIDASPTKARPASLWELVEPPEGGAPLAQPEQLRDAWGNDLVLEPVGDQGWRLRSVGPDDRYGTADDLLREMK